MTTTNDCRPYATTTTTFAIAGKGGVLFFYSVTGNSADAEVISVTATRTLQHCTSVAAARKAYAKAKANGALLSTEAAQQVVDGDAKLVRLTQKGRAFFRAVTGSPFRYAEGCMKRSGVVTGYDVIK